MLHRLSKYLLFITLAGCGGGAIEEGVDQDEIYAAWHRIWASRNVPVCWLNPGTDWEARAWVQYAVEREWANNSSVTFTGWGACGSDRCWPGIKIKISDERPYTRLLGNPATYPPSQRCPLPLTRNFEIVPDVKLNFTFNNWSWTCQAHRRDCIEAQAVHEMGHVLGFSHEQNRPDTPDANCAAQAQGANGNTLVGAWDLSSVMNYCNPLWNNGGRLSAGDILGVQTLYGPPCTRCAGICTNFQADRLNCGGCGISCGTGECVAGTCQGRAQIPPNPCRANPALCR